jgi:hypothetical protein
MLFALDVALPPFVNLGLAARSFSSFAVHARINGYSQVSTLRRSSSGSRAVAVLWL